ncbi:pesticidal protein Cry7Aa [Patescibacteria group bacterium]
MIKLKKHGVILKPTNNNFETRSVLNPGVCQDGQNVHLIYRAIDENYLSSLGYARLNGPTTVDERWDKPFMFPKYKVEKCGIEDPRITKIKDTLYMTYVVHNCRDAITCFSYGDDLFNLKRGHLISPKIPYKEAGKIFQFSKLKDKYYFFESFYQKYSEPNVLIWHKDCILFPEKINGKYAMLQRILPDIQLMYFGDFSELENKYFWINNIMHLAETVIMEAQHGFESRHLGGGCPPIKTEAGWLLIYHSAQARNKGRIYYGGAALLDYKNPLKVIARLPYPILSPEENYETTGIVNNVAFPTGSAIFDNVLYIYYGAADKYVAVASININELINELHKHKV